MRSGPEFHARRRFALVRHARQSPMSPLAARAKAPATAPRPHPFGPRPRRPRRRSPRASPAKPPRTGWGPTSPPGGTPGQRAAGAWPPAPPRGRPGGPSGTGGRCRPWDRCSAAGTAAGRRAAGRGGHVWLGRRATSPRRPPKSVGRRGHARGARAKQTVRLTTAPWTMLRTPGMPG